jgi:hypothetical protein
VGRAGRAAAGAATFAQTAAAELLSTEGYLEAADAAERAGLLEPEPRGERMLGLLAACEREREGIEQGLVGPLGRIGLAARARSATIRGSAEARMSDGNEPAAEPAIAVHADFAEDVRVHLLGVLTQAGILVPAAEQDDVERVCFAYFNVLGKLIEPRVRRVEYSRELRGRPLAQELWDGVHLVEARSFAGESLETLLSERATRPHTHDWLRNDWGIHHIHLRPRRGQDELLYVLVQRDALYFIDVRGHGAMADVDLLEIVLANWPALLRPLPGIHGGQRLSGKDIADARRAGLQVIMTLSDGQAYAPLGGGITTARGSSLRAGERSDDVLQAAWQHEQQARAEAASIAAELGLTELHLRYDPGAGTVTETVTGKVIFARG